MPGKILAAAYDGVYELKFTGDVRLTVSGAIDGFLERMFSDAEFKSVLVDLSEIDAIDSTSLGLLAKLSIEAGRRFDYVPTLVSTRPDVTRILLTMGFEDVFHIIDSPLSETAQLTELPRLANTREDVLRSQVIDAHRTLMSMNARNEDTFRDLMAALEDDLEDSNPPPQAASL
ncbi:MAG: STAS domain-containing protein [Gammaproteobacteria bacterium]|nr:STAS domain-containing protein [Gammaproteobacteria bacterium]